LGKLKNVKSPKILAKNVTEFQHFLKHNWITEMDLEWVAKLRKEEKDYSKLTMEKAVVNAPKVAEMATESSKTRKSINDINFKGNLGEYCRT
jgi:hypothetical protein